MTVIDMNKNNQPLNQWVKLKFSSVRIQTRQGTNIYQTSSATKYGSTRSNNRNPISTWSFWTMMTPFFRHRFWTQRLTMWIWSLWPGSTTISWTKSKTRSLRCWRSSWWRPRCSSSQTPRMAGSNILQVYWCRRCIKLLWNIFLWSQLAKSSSLNTTTK